MTNYPPFQIFSLMKHVPERLFNSVAEIEQHLLKVRKDTKESKTQVKAAF